MINGQRYKTPEERTEAFRKFCVSKECDKCVFAKQKGISLCEFGWLTLEAEEELLACPFCGGEAEVVVTHPVSTEGVYVHCKECGAFVTAFHTEADAIAAWNRRAK